MSTLPKPTPPTATTKEKTGRKRTNTKSPGSNHETSFSELQKDLTQDLASPKEDYGKKEKKKGIFSFVTRKMSKRADRKLAPMAPPPATVPSHESSEGIELRYSPSKKNRPKGFMEAQVNNPLLEKRKASVERRNTLDDLEKDEPEQQLIGHPALEAAGRGRGVMPSILQSKNMSPPKHHNVPFPSILMDNGPKKVNDASDAADLAKSPGRGNELPSILIESKPLSAIKKSKSRSHGSGNKTENVTDTPGRRRRKRKKRHKPKKGEANKENIADFI